MKLFAKVFSTILLAIVMLIATAEIVGRQIGLTNPPLSVFDEQMEYRYAPNQDCLILGRRFAINEFSQRSDPVKPKNPGDLRVLVIGDSIPSGGTQVDQADLATSILEKQLASKTARRAQVLNASAGSWGPGNELAYVKKFGTFDADLFVVILSTQDSNDVMSFEPTVGVNSSYPDKKPLSTCWMLYDRYLPRMLAIMQAQKPGNDPPPTIDQSVMNSITELVQHLKSTGKPVVVLLHPLRDELKLSADPEAWTAIKNAALNGGAIIYDPRAKYRAAIDRGVRFYRDYIHPNPAGQHVLADALEDAVLPLVQK